jgi:hypothetical protein
VTKGVRQPGEVASNDSSNADRHEIVEGIAHGDKSDRAFGHSCHDIPIQPAHGTVNDGNVHLRCLRNSTKLDHVSAPPDHNSVTHC